MTKVYLAGAINGCNDAQCNDWREKVKQLLHDDLIDCRAEIINPMSRDYRGREDRCVNSVVELDKVDIDSCDIIIANCPVPSWGTGMEIFYAWSNGKPVIAVVPADKPVSPWLRYHTKAVCYTYEEAVELAKQWVR